METSAQASPMQNCILYKRPTIPYRYYMEGGQIVRPNAWHDSAGLGPAIAVKIKQIKSFMSAGRECYCLTTMLPILPARPGLPFSIGGTN